MSKSNNTENAILALIFNATAWADLAENDTSSPAANLYVALHTSDPGEAGAADANECTYGAYARVAVARTSGGWTVSGNAVTNAADIEFPTATSGSETATWASVTKASSGASDILYRAEITSPASGLAISTGIKPTIAAGSLDFTED